MRDFFGINIKSYLNRPNEIRELLADYLNVGSLGIILGSGASNGFELPTWHELVKDLVVEADLNLKIRKNESSAVLKEHVEEISTKLSSKYLDTVYECLYKKAAFDFSTANKDLLIAISALCTGSNRGSVKTVFTYNFDSVLEWYLGIIGLKVSVYQPSNMLDRFCDVETIHFHGYLPHSSLNHDRTDFIVFSKSEFEEKEWKRKPLERKRASFFLNKLFLSIGVSLDTLDGDVRPRLKQLMGEDYRDLKRNSPFGIAIIGVKKMSGDEATKYESKINRLMDSGVIPVFLEFSQIPKYLFSIVQKALQV
ncbi:MAG: SIR2 family protein [Bacteroidota bacterium]